MPSSAEIPAAGERRSRREMARTAALVILAILITLFAVFNLKEVKVNWVFGSGKAPLIIVIVVSLLVGIVLAIVDTQNEHQDLCSSFRQVEPIMVPRIDGVNLAGGHPLRRSTIRSRSMLWPDRPWSRLPSDGSKSRTAPKCRAERCHPRAGE